MEEKIMKLVTELSRLGWVTTIENEINRSVILKTSKIDYKRLKEIIDNVDYIGEIEKTVIVGDDDSVRVVITLRR